MTFARARRDEHGEERSADEADSRDHHVSDDSTTTRIARARSKSAGSRLVHGASCARRVSARAHLAFDEEMLVLKRRTPPANSIVVGAGAGYLVMRWDGNCYTLDEGELTAKKPPSPRHASLPWRYYTERTKSALLEHPKVAAALQRRGKECKGAVSGDVTKACEQADAALSTAIVSEIRSGATIPTPDHLP